MYLLFKSNLATVSQLESGILYCDFYLETYDNMDDARAHIRQLQNTVKKEKKLFLINIVGVKKASKPFRDYMASDDLASVSIAHAVYLDSGIAKIMGNLYVRFSKPKVPTKMFTNEGEAIAWLLTFQ